MQFEQGFLQRRIDHRFTLSDKQTVSPHVPPLPHAPLKKTMVIAKMFNKSPGKIETKVTSRSPTESSKFCRTRNEKRKETKV
jgi:hypothetical protein